ncbi:MAG: hypothetical protein HY897_00160 [Deltaproteobacteria bacterium]|nr:hypothetical protein [Deltaproteobacteria bacterium]
MKITCVRTQRVMATVVMVAMMSVACQERSVETRQDGGEGKEESQTARHMIDPGLMFVWPAELETNRSVSRSVEIGFHGIPEGYLIFENEMPPDWAQRMKRILRFIDVETEADLPYGLEKKLGRPEKIRLKPEKGIEPGKGYRVALDLCKGGSPIAGVKILDQYLLEVTNRQVSVEFYTYSRPMLSRVGYSENHGTIDFEFSEALRVDEMVNRERVVFVVDGVTMDPCADPYDRDCLDHPIGHGPYEHNGEMIELTGGILLSFPDGLGAFSEMSLRLPHAIRGLDGSLLDGAPNNRVATLDGDFIVYTIKFADMRETQPGLWEWKY